MAYITSNVTRNPDVFNSVHGASGTVDEDGILETLIRRVRFLSIQNTGETDLYFAIGGNVPEITGNTPTAKVPAGTSVSIEADTGVVYLKAGAGETADYNILAMYFNAVEVTGES